MIQPVRLLAAVTVCAALLIPARIAFSAQTAAEVGPAAPAHAAP